MCISAYILIKIVQNKTRQNDQNFSKQTMENPYFTKTFIYAIKQNSCNGMLNIAYLKSDKK